MKNEKKILHLTIKKEWFDLIAQGIKKEEYRDIKTFWESRLTVLCLRDYHGNDSIKCDCSGVIDDGQYACFRKYDEVHFRNGYNPTSPFLRIEFNGCDFGHANPDWCPKGTTGNYFRIKLGEVLETKNWKP